MEEEFERKARCVATTWEALKEEKDWHDVLKHFDLGFPYAWLVYQGYGTLNKTGREQVISTYDFLLKALEIPEANYFNYWEMLKAFEEKEANSPIVKKANAVSPIPEVRKLRH